MKVAEALAKVTEHKKALEEAEKIEKEFMSLMTGQRHSENEGSSPKNNSDVSTIIIAVSVQYICNEITNLHVFRIRSLRMQW